MNITSLRIIEEVKKIGLDKPNFTYAPTENMTGGHIAFVVITDLRELEVR